MATTVLSLYSLDRPEIQDLSLNIPVEAQQPDNRGCLQMTLSDPQITDNQLDVGRGGVAAPLQMQDRTTIRATRILRLLADAWRTTKNDDEMTKPCEAGVEAKAEAQEEMVEDEDRLKRMIRARQPAMHMLSPDPPKKKDIFDHVDSIVKFFVVLSTFLDLTK